MKADVEAREEEAMRLQKEIEDAKRQLEVFLETEIIPLFTNTGLFFYIRPTCN